MDARKALKIIRTRKKAAVRRLEKSQEPTTHLLNAIELANEGVYERARIVATTFYNQVELDKSTKSRNKGHLDWRLQTHFCLSACLVVLVVAHPIMSLT